jgi:hypothetical protein
VGDRKAWLLQKGGRLYVCVLCVCVCLFVCLVEELLAQFCNNFGTHKYLGFSFN